MKLTITGSELLGDWSILKELMYIEGSNSGTYVSPILYHCKSEDLMAVVWTTASGAKNIRFEEYTKGISDE